MRLQTRRRLRRLLEENARRRTQVIRLVALAQAYHEGELATWRSLNELNAALVVLLPVVRSLRPSAETRVLVEEVEQVASTVLSALQAFTGRRDLLRALHRSIDEAGLQEGGSPARRET